MGSQAHTASDTTDLAGQSSASVSTSTAHIAGIDGLRALAVLAVIIYHFVPAALPGGFAGVDVFFVISGYVVTGSLLRSKATSLRSFLAAFYVRRILRIFPALVACLIVTSLAYALVVPDSALSKTSAKTAIAAFAGLSNFALILFDDGYFSPKVEFNLFTHTWSLAVEEQFYVLFPFLFWFATRPHVNSVARRFANWSIPGLIVASLITAALWTGSHADWSYYLLPSRFWELGAGAALALLHQRGKLQVAGAGVKELCTIAGLVLVGVALIATDKALFPFPWAIAPVLGTSLLIVGITGKSAGGSSSAFAAWPVVYIGRLSYSLYLWHWPIIVLMRWTWGADSAFDIFIATMATFAMAALSYHLVEGPVRDNKSLNGLTKKRMLVIGTSTVASALVFCGMIFYCQPYLSMSVTADKAVWSPEAAYMREQLPPPMKASERQVFVYGDSHAWAYESMLKRLQSDEGVKVSSYTHYGCGIANLMRPTNPACATALEKDLQDIEKKAQPGDVLFLASLRMNRLGDQWGPLDQSQVVTHQESALAAKERAIALRQADALISRMEAKGLRVIIDAPKPVFPTAPFRCSDWFNAKNPSCTAGFTVARTFLVNFRQPTMQTISTLVQRHPTLVVWDSFPILCPAGERCNAFDGDKPMYFDGDHLSGHGNALLYPAFRSLVAPLLSS